MDITYNELYGLMETIDNKYRKYNTDYSAHYDISNNYIADFYQEDCTVYIYILYTDDYLGNEAIPLYFLCFSFISNDIEINIKNDDIKKFDIKNIVFDKCTDVVDVLCEHNFLKESKQKSARSVVSSKA